MSGEKAPTELDHRYGGCMHAVCKCYDRNVLAGAGRGYALQLS